MTDDVTRLVAEWMERREWIEDCTCDWDEGGTCWYHLTAHQKQEERARSLAEFMQDVTQAQHKAFSEIVRRVRGQHIVGWWEDACDRILAELEAARRGEQEGT